jgi:hypothetical protein
MSQVLELSVPDELALRAQTEARRSARPVQAVMLDWLQAGADDLEHLPDSQLLAICDGSMNPADHTALSELLTRNRDGQLDAAERSRLQSLMSDYQHGLLRKARAWRIAVARGLRTSLD